MRVIITCGPSFEPIDKVRRLTNFSTGELGMRIANALKRAGHEVICFKGAGATCIELSDGFAPNSFTTNDDLFSQLQRVENRETVDAFFHVAALCDYQVAGITDRAGTLLNDAKIPSDSGELVIRLKPAPKLIAGLRGLFSKSRIVGWKYELEGNKEQALAKGWRQMTANQTDACVVNGAALGSGFAWCEPGQPVMEFPDKPTLARWIVQWLENGSLP